MSGEEREMRIGISISCKVINGMVEAAGNRVAMDVDGVGSSKEMDTQHASMSEITEAVMAVVSNDIGTDIRSNGR